MTSSFIQSSTSLTAACLVAGMLSAPQVLAQAAMAPEAVPAPSVVMQPTVPQSAVGTDASAAGDAKPEVVVAVSCLLPPAKLTDAEIASFLADPGALLRISETGGEAMTGHIGRLAASSSETLDTLVSLVATANREQITAFGHGLAHAALSCGKTDAIYAALIQTKVAEMNNEAFSVAFADGLSDLETAALGGVSGVASGIGNGGRAGGGSAGLTGDEAIETTSGIFDGTGEGSFFSGNGGGRSSPTSVSPN